MFSVILYASCAILAILLLLIRRKLAVFGYAELGGPKGAKFASGLFLVILWFFYVIMSSLQAYKVIEVDIWRYPPWWLWCFFLSSLWYFIRLLILAIYVNLFEINQYIDILFMSFYGMLVLENLIYPSPNIVNLRGNYKTAFILKSKFTLIMYCFVTFSVKNNLNL